MGAWISDFLPVELLLLFLAEKEVIIFTDDIPFDKILTNNLSENELGNIINVDSKLFAKMKKVEE